MAIEFRNPTGVTYTLVDGREIFVADALWVRRREIEPGFDVIDAAVSELDIRASFMAEDVDSVAFNFGSKKETP